MIIKLKVNVLKLDKSAFFVGEKGTYVNLAVFVNDDGPDQYGNDASIQTSFKDATKDDKHYFGNLKHSEFKEAHDLEAGSNDIPEADDLPF